jgi:hypothetical protein
MQLKELKEGELARGDSAITGAVSPIRPFAHSQYPSITHLQDTLELALPRDRTMLVCHGRPTWNLSSAILGEIVQDDRSDRFWISFNDSPSFGPGKEYETA